MRYKVIVAYDGSHYVGWQTQHQNNSVQEAIECVLYQIHKQKIEIVGSGRTDAKVHAKGQVFHFDSNLSMSAEAIERACNSLLSKDIRVQSVHEVCDDFHARFHAKRKCYEYLISKEMNNPFIQSYMSIESNALDINKMQKCADIFVGTHDFTSFTSARIDVRKSRVKTIHSIDIQEYDSYIKLRFEGNGFLRYMVRMLTQTIIEAGKGKLEISEVERMLKARSKEVCRYKASPCGLYLAEVIYEE